MCVSDCDLLIAGDNERKAVRARTGAESDSGRPGRRFGRSDRLYEGLQGAQARGSEEEALGR